MDGAQLGWGSKFSLSLGCLLLTCH